MNSNSKKLIIFWIIAIPFLIGWYLYWNSEKEIEVANVSQDPSRLEEIKTSLDIVKALSEKDGQEKTFLLLFQNDMELRPSGGYLGTFGILKIKDGQLVSIESHDTNIFDGRIPDGIDVPFPMEEMLGISDWKMRDSNWHPDFVLSAQETEKFYKLGQGQEEFFAVIAINTHVLSSVLEATGEIKIASEEEAFDSENAILKLERQVEKDYLEEGKEVAQRKAVVGELAQAIVEKIKAMSYKEKLELLRKLEDNLNQKDIQIYFKDQSLQEKIRNIGWSGEVDKDWEKDYLMIVDSNLGALKSDRVIERSIEYTVDFSSEKPKAKLKVIYNHKGEQKDWMTKDYQGYLRVYTPEGSWLKEASPLGEQNFFKDYGKKVFGMIVKAPLRKETVISFDYDLGEEVTFENYELLIEKQSGIDQLPIKVTVIDPQGNEKGFYFEVENKYILSY